MKRLGRRKKILEGKGERNLCVRVCVHVYVFKVHYNSVLSRSEAKHRVSVFRRLSSSLCVTAIANDVHGRIAWSRSHEDTTQSTKANARSCTFPAVSLS